MQSDAVPSQSAAMLEDADSMEWLLWMDIASSRSRGSDAERGT